MPTNFADLVGSMFWYFASGQQALQRLPGRGWQLRVLAILIIIIMILLIIMIIMIMIVLIITIIIMQIILIQYAELPAATWEPLECLLP